MSSSGTIMPPGAVRQPLSSLLTASGDCTDLLASSHIDLYSLHLCSRSEVDAQAWLAAHIRSSRLTAWNTTVAGDKAMMLQQATDHIDALPLRGHIYCRDGSQVNQLPQECRDGYYINEITGLDWVLPVAGQICPGTICFILRTCRLNAKNDRTIPKNQALTGQT